MKKRPLIVCKEAAERGDVQISLKLSDCEGTTNACNWRDSKLQHFKKARRTRRADIMIGNLRWTGVVFFRDRLSFYLRGLLAAFFTGTTFAFSLPNHTRFGVAIAIRT